MNTAASRAAIALALALGAAQAPAQAQDAPGEASAATRARQQAIIAALPPKAPATQATRRAASSPRARTR